MFVHVPMIMPITCRSTTLQNNVDQFSKKYKRKDRISTHFVYLHRFDPTLSHTRVVVWNNTPQRICALLVKLGHLELGTQKM